MYKTLGLSMCALLFSLPVPPAASAADTTTGSVVITFKDGHQQTIPASAIAEMEFKSASGTTAPIEIPSIFVPGKRRFVGKWVVGDGMGNNFDIILDEDGHARKTNGDNHGGTWVYVDGEARISWEDGWRDVIRKVGSKYQKEAHSPGSSFSDEPSNVAEAHAATPRPI